MLAAQEVLLLLAFHRFRFRNGSGSIGMLESIRRLPLERREYSSDWEFAKLSWGVTAMTARWMMACFRSSSNAFRFRFARM